MKKTIALLTALIMVTVMLASLAMATEDNTDPIESETYLLDGQVSAFGDGYIMMLLDGAEYQINVNDSTVLEGTETLAIGDWLQIVHNGQMTRSVPPQVTAQVIRSYSISGTVSGLTDGSFTVTGEDGAEIIVNYDPERFIGVQDTMQITVWFDGMMTRSLPAQITAEHIRTQELTGTITEITEEGFLMADADGIETFVRMSNATLLFTEIAVDTAVRVVTDGTATMSLPAQVIALEILPVPAEAAAEEPTVEEAEEASDIQG